MLEKIIDFYQQHKYKILAGVSFAAAGYFALQYFKQAGQTKWSSFVEAVKQDKVRQVVVDGQTAFFRSQTSQWFKTHLSTLHPGSIWQIVKDKNIVFSEKEEVIPVQIYATLAASIVSIASFKYLAGSLDQKDYTPIDLKTTIVENKTYLSDFYGGQEVKEMFKETIDFLNFPQKYQEMGARIRRGILFYGPPGTGKTMLARALATEAGCHFISAVASQFQQVYVGVGAKRVRELFKAARSHPEGCIIFIDEIDALGSRANHLRDSHQTTTTINQFLNQIDGFNPSQKVLVVAATNRLDLVDQAVLRAGRFDVKIHISLPTLQQRKGILWKILDRKLGIHHNIQDRVAVYLSHNTENWSGADLESLINEAIYRAIAEHSQKLEDQHLMQAFEEIHLLR